MGSVERLAERLVVGVALTALAAAFVGGAMETVGVGAIGCGIAGIPVGIVGAYWISRKADADA